MIYRPSSKLFSWYYLSIISLTLVVGIGTTVWAYNKTSQDMKRDLVIDVSSIATAFDKDDIVSLLGTASDINNPDYLSLKNKLEQIRALNKDVRFVYLLGYRDEKVYFMVDSEPATSADYSPPGQIYEEATPIEKRVLQGKSPSAIEFNEDRWGSWFTALVPILDGEHIIAVMGMDVSSSKYYKNIYTAIAIPVISTIFVLLLILVGLFLRRNEESYLKFKDNIFRVATHDLRSPLTGVSWMIDTILDNKDSVKDETRTNLEDVNTRIKKLLSSVNEILASIDKGRKKEDTRE